MNVKINVSNTEIHITEMLLLKDTMKIVLNTSRMTMLRLVVQLLLGPILMRLHNDLPHVIYIQAPIHE
tara:strand:+ start:2891 stop:3094 length:204 start_codon:yes stop_codon:yes gene_type:complete